MSEGLGQDGLSLIPEAQRVITSLPLAVILLQPDGRVAEANPAAEQFFGQSVRRLHGRKCSDLLIFKDRRLAERIAVQDAAISAHRVDVFVQGQGTRRLDITAAPVADHFGWQVITLHDSTANETMADDAGAGEETFLRAPEVLAHEIKNPLAGIRGAAQLLARKLPEKEQALTNLIAGEVDRIARLIDQMQALSQRTSMPLEACNPHESIRRAIEVLNLAGSGQPHESVTVREEFDPSLPFVSGNPDALVQVLINLLSNARDACEESVSPQIFVRTRFASGLQQQVGGGKSVRLPIEIRVSDNGPGVDPLMRDVVFEPFVTSKKTGQGLGLPLVRKLVRDMNGRLTYERDDQGGWTHFRVYLPLAHQDNLLNTSDEVVA